MKALHAFLPFVIVGVVCCKPDLWLVGGKTLDALSSDSDEDNSSQQSSTSENIRSVDIFMRKIATRLNTSTILADQPDIKSRLIAVAVHKFKQCETSLNQEDVAAHNHRSCLGAATGRMMALISGFEKNQNMLLPDPQNQTNFK